MKGIRGTFNSKRSIAWLIAIGLATILVFAGYMTAPDWASLVKYLTIALLVSHTATGIVTPGTSSATPATVDTPKAPGV